jgi:hypothetical protein
MVHDQQVAPPFDDRLHLAIVRKRGRAIGGTLDRNHGRLGRATATLPATRQRQDRQKDARPPHQLRFNWLRSRTAPRAALVVIAA